MITDLTKEHPDKLLWRFWLPLMISVIFQQFYNIADSMIAGKFAGESALGAVGASYPITIIYMAFAVGMNLGALVVISRLFGAGDKAGLRRAVSTAFISVLGTECATQCIWIFLQRSHDALDPYTGRHYGRRCSVSEDLCVRSELSAVFTMCAPAYLPHLVIRKRRCIF